VQTETFKIPVRLLMTGRQMKPRELGVDVQLTGESLLQLQGV